jgi:hypothetical protein
VWPPRGGRGNQRCQGGAGTYLWRAPGCQWLETDGLTVEDQLPAMRRQRRDHLERPGAGDRGERPTGSCTRSATPPWRSRRFLATPA